MTSNITNYTSCDVTEAILSNYSGSKRVNIADLIGSVNFRESIFDSALYGSIGILDTVGLLENFPLMGEETLDITVVSHDYDTTKKLKLAIHKVADVSSKNLSDGYVYNLYFTTKSSFDAGFRKTITSFEKEVYEMAKDIFDQTYEPIKDTPAIPNEGAEVIKISGGRNFVVERSDGIVRCLIPNYDPQRTMSFLSVRANSDKSPSCSFKFFETMDGYNFVSDEYLIRDAIKNNKIKTFYYNDNYDMSPGNLEYQKRKFETFYNSYRADTMSDLHSGAYNVNLLELDLFEKKVNEFKYKFEDNKNMFLRTSGTKNSKEAHEKHSSRFVRDYFNDENQRIVTFVKDYDSYSNMQIKGDTFLPSIINNRRSYEYLLSTTQVDATIKGRLDVRAGDLIYVDIKQFSSDSSKTDDSKMSGNYMVSTVNNSIVGSELTTTLILLKFGWV